MAIRGKDQLGKYALLTIGVSDTFSKVKLATSYYAKNYVENFDSISITGDEEDKFLQELGRIRLEIATYLTEAGLDRQGHIEDDSKYYVIGAEKPLEKVDAETALALSFYIRDNWNVSDSYMDILERKINDWAVESLIDRLLNPLYYKGELKPVSLHEAIEKTIFYLTLK